MLRYPECPVDVYESSPILTPQRRTHVDLASSWLLVVTATSIEAT